VRYSLVGHLACPVCLGELVAVVASERAAAVPVRPFREACNRVAVPGAVVAPHHTTPGSGAVAAALARHASVPAPPHRDNEVEIETGLLVCRGCDRWFPVRGLLPELLPDHLRDHGRDAGIFEACCRVLPEDLAAALRSAAPTQAPADADAGIGYKRAEIGIESKVDDPAFFAPGYTSPFNMHNPEFTLYLIKLFGAAVPLLELRAGSIMLDSGCGYAWTTEWLFKAGVEAIGVDICRKYLEVGLERLGANHPHLVVADVEHLPIRNASMDAVFAYESFHHVPDRNRAMAGYGRVLKPEGRVVLAEPGSAHEEAQVAVDVMRKYGILEKGMELEDVREYVAGTPLGGPEQVFVLRVPHRELGRRLDRFFVRTHSALEGNLFRISRPVGLRDAVAAAWREPRRTVWPKVKRRLKTALVRLGLD
jgi:SAM-dependent methyltransferase/uncharacterized protein YbaR (Trm112 family)